ncbi:non-ribosomal peptide synthetase [Stappia indica]|uniref:Amino acid adenylation domain-containing protein n=1 Tax=Stappia indica TaxID=538381 RepID=A0A285T8K0_9HYPH|nr:non-ribosomal peptide synthetase [Stappia indica]SOC15867.1 amino acid adenylation domain-containing protein [Stappia indica]
MTDDRRPEDLKARMARQLEQELIERARARAASRRPEPEGASAPSAPAPLSARLAEDVHRLASEALRIPQDKLDPTENLANLGIDSIAITEVMARISRHFAITVAPTTFFEAKHLDDLAAILLARYGKAVEASYAARAPEPAPAQPASTVAPPHSPPTAGTDGAADVPEAWLARHRAFAKGQGIARVGEAARPVQQPLATATEEQVPIAVISMEGRFPQSPDLETFAAHLAAGDDCIEEVPADRWDWRAVHGDPKKGPFTDVKYGGFTPGHDLFDAAFFNISPREAELMDPQHRLFMECVWSLIEKAGHAPGSLAGRKVGLFLGINLLDYTDMVNRAGIMDAQQLTGLGHAFCPNRLSFLLDIHGPSSVVDTACSSSLVAIHRAIMSIRHEGCEMAIAGGSNLMLSPMQHIMFSQVGMITPDGRCKTFSADANGYARADGVGAVLLKRLDAAERDGDPILGVIRASVEHHGGGATSLTAPNPKAQARLVAEAHRLAGIDPRSISLIECHGTGTPLGDPVEVEGLKTAFAELYRELGLPAPDVPHIGLGSVKSNIGHAETAAGVAGLIKVLLAMRAGTLFRTLHCEEPNPLLELEGSPFYLLQAARHWDRPVVDGTEQPRRAGLSSFGAGGANVHMVIEEYRGPQPVPTPVPSPMIVPLSARTPDALADAIRRLRPHVAGADLGDLAWTLQVGRDAMRERIAFVARDAEDLLRQMDAVQAGADGDALRGTVPRGRRADETILDPIGRDPRDVARAWVGGADVDWQQLHAGTTRRRLALPSYPFQRKRYWLPMQAAPATPASGLSPSQVDAGTFEIDLTGREFFLADHRIGGRPVLPGVAYLELVRAAAVKAGLTRPLLRQVVWMSPLAVESPVRVRVVFTQAADGARRAEVLSVAAGEEPRLHAQMMVTDALAASPAAVDLAALKLAHPGAIPADRVYAAFDAMGLVYGPGHRAIASLALGPGADGERSVLARLRLPGAIAATVNAYALHPSLMDGAFQAAIGLVLEEAETAPKGAALPFAIEAVEIFGPLETDLWVHIQPRPASGGDPRTRRMDLLLLDDAGNARVALRGFATRSYVEAPPQDTQCFVPVWRPVEGQGAADRPGRHLVLVAADTVKRDGLAPHLADAEVVELAGDPTGDPAARFEAAALQLLDVLKAQSGRALVQVVVPGGEGRQALSGLVGLLRSAAREHSGLAGQLIALEPGVDAASVAAHLLQAAGHLPLDRLRLGSGGLEAETWEELGEETRSSRGEGALPLRAGGIYLITGGTGGLGRHLARAILASAPGAKVVLASRRAAAPRAEDGLSYATADLSDAQSAQALVDDIRARHGRLDGVFHAAGVLRDEALHRKTAEQLREVFAPKVRGLVNLDRALGAAPLDFLVLFSSISGVLGNPGQADYGAANGFLDGFAEDREARRRRGACQGRTLSIPWPLWRDGGMGMDAATEALMRRTTGLVPLETAAGVNVLAALLADEIAPGAARVLVTAGERERIRDLVARTATRPQTGAESVPRPAAAPRVDTGDLRQRVLRAVSEEAGAILKVALDDLDADVELTEYGFDSISFTQFANRLNDRFGLDLTPTLFFEHPVLETLAEHLADRHPEAMVAVLGGAPAPQAAPPAVPDIPAAVVSRVQVPAAVAETASGAVAIIGMSGIFPGAPDVASFWQNLVEGRDSISEVPAERWDWRDWWGDPQREPGRTNVKWGGFIGERLAEFDAAFFGISAPEARMIDPQQRLLLTEAWRVMEDAGYAPSHLAGSRTGVFLGTADTGYSRLVAASGSCVEGYSMTGLAPSLGPNRISYYYDFHGPSVAVETACSSALVAVHRAVEAIRSGHCDAAIAGGINALLLPEAFVGFSRAGMLSPDGRSKPFSDAANGYARGEGVGLVFLKPLEAAERDGDDIIAVIRASAENHGGHAASLTAPNPKAQAELLRTAYRAAGFDPRTVGYIEAHGTGTPLGDPIEVEALSAAFADLAREAEGRFGAGAAPSCGIGSVKSNIGHLELAAGIAGLIKVLLQIRHGKMAATLHCDRLNPYLKLEGSPFFVVREAREWPRARDASGRELPRRAGVSSFGFGGSNAHVVLEEHVAVQAALPTEAGGLAVLVLSARSEDQLRTMASDLRRYLDEAGEAVPLADVAYTLQVARDAMEHRLAFVASGRSEALKRLDAFLAGDEAGGLHVGRVRTNRAVISVLEGDADLRQAAAGLVSRGQHDELLALWVRGLDVDWTQLPGSAGRRRVRLPGYPFARTRHWVRGGEAAPARSASLLLDGSESFLRDHLVGGRKVLPGVVQFEQVRAELERRGFAGLPLEFTGHVWMRPVAVDEAPVRLEVELGEAGDSYRILTSGREGRQVHGEGRVRAAPDAALPPVDLDALRRGMSETVDPSGLYARFAALGLGYGPAHRPITSLATGNGYVLARLELPAAATDGMALHPSMLDGALQALLALASGDEAALAVPYALRRLVVIGPTEPVMWAVGERDGATHTLRLCDETGRVLALFEGFSARTVSPPPAGRSSVEEAPSVRPAEVSAAVLDRVTAIAARVLEVDPSVLDTETELGEFGFDSITMTGFAAAINDELDLSLTPADFFEFATLARLARHVAGLVGPELVAAPTLADAQPAVADLPPVVDAPRPASDDAFAADDPVVIVGLSCTFPMARNADAFWQNLVEGRDCITRIPPDRWDWRAIDGDPREEPGRTNIHWGGFIDGVFEFDPLFFGISPREARLMDPQQRLMMMHAWNAIEDAGHAPHDLAGRKVGIFVGTSTSGYRDLVAGDTGGDGYVATGAVASVGPNRISYFLDLHGPSEPVETACSSSLVALHRAVRSIRGGDCEMALVGGVNTIVTPEAHINFAKAGMLAPDGRCKTFSAQANGYVRGEGAGMVLLRRLSDALRDGDPVLAVIRGTAVNHGGRANSLTAPNTQAQADLLRAAYRDAGIDPSTVGYIEAHGTGTALGDPVEINALKAVFAGERAQGSCGIGSVKTNIGHLELAAGIAGLAKVLLQMRHRRLVPSLHCDTLNPYIEFAGSPFEVVRQGRPWTAPRDAAGRELQLRAGVSSFGFGGVNAHAVLEDYPSAPQSAAALGPQLIVLSARDAARLRERASDLAEALKAGFFTDADLADIAFTLRVGRTPMKQRLAFVAYSLADAVRMLTAYLGGASAPRLLAGDDAASVRNPMSEPASLEDWAGHFVTGGDLSGFAEAAGPRRRIRLPGYPFARDIYRAGGGTDRSQPADAARGAAVTEEIGAPFVRRLEASAFYLRDHRFRDMPILPAAMGLELARSAFVAAGGHDPVRLENVTWRRPLELASGSVEVRLPLEDGEAGARGFRLLSGTGTEHMRGSVVALPTGSTPARLDIAARRGNCPAVLDRDWLYASYAALGLAYGPAFRCVVEMQAGDGEALARLRLPEAARGETFHLHPSMLDAAFHAALGLFHGEPGGTAALPFALDRMDVFGPTDEEMWAHLRERPAADGLRRIDIDLADSAGTVRVAIRGFTLRLVRGASLPEETRSPAKPGTSASLVTAAERYLAEVVARETEVPLGEIDPQAALETYGIDSLLITRLTDELGKVFGPLSSTLFFEHQTIASLAGHFASAHAEKLSEVVGAAPADAAPATVAPAAEPVRERTSSARYEPIAIIGLAGRYPGARDVETFWENLAAGRDCITEIPTERWDHARFHDPEGRGGLPRGKWGGFVDDFDRFDPLFFNISPREAPYLDPQERLFLQCAWETLEDAGYTRETVAPATEGMAGGDVGVFVGVMYEEYQLYGAESTAAGRPLALSGSAASIANRVSYFCDFHGPSMAVDSMCSSSLTAIHLACEALRAGDCRVALAGGVNLTLHPNKYLALAQGRFLSSSGRCESFGEGGDGYVPSEGVGAVLLKPLSRAVADGDRIHGVIRASALNHGGKTNGYTVPNPLAQAAVIGRAMQRAGVRAEDIGYVEAHGTGTSLGDPIEIAALSRAYRRETGACGFCAIGSVKSNIGHGESAAGIAGLTKVLLQFRHGRLAPSLHSATTNREIDFAASPFRVEQRLEDWPRRRDGQGNELQHLAALSSFGAGGSNAHLIIEDYPVPARREVAPARSVYPFSAREAGQLQQVLERFRACLDVLPEADLPAAAATLQEGREAFEERLAIVAGDRAELARLLDAALQGGEGGGIWRGRAPRNRTEDTLPASLEAAAAAWVGGTRVDWRQLRGGARPIPVGLPTYPFARERYWLPEGVAVAPRTEAPAPTPALPLLFRPHWQEKDLPAAALASLGRHVVVLYGATDDTASRLRLQMPQARIVQLESRGAEESERFADHAAGLLALVKDVAASRVDTTTLQLVLPAADTLAEGLAGLLRCARLEHRTLACQAISLDLTRPDLAEVLAREAAVAQSDHDIRYSRDQRLVRSWREVEAVAQALTVPWKPDGVYLVTGGAGGVGLHVAADIVAKAPGATVWLTGRSARPDALEETLARLGPRAVYRQADVVDKAAMRALVAEIRAVHGHLDGVVHAAGLTRDSLIANKSEADLRAVLAPKVAGTLALDAALGGDPLDFLVLFASASGALGNPGQADYAAANAFLDAFSQERNRRAARGACCGHTLSIDWPYWQDGGMRLPKAVVSAMERQAGAVPLATEAALATLAFALQHSGEDQLLVLSGDKSRLRKLVQSSEDGTASPASPARAAKVASVAVEVASDAVLDAVRACFSQVLKIPAERLGADETIDRFGVDSVSALDIVAALETRFGSLPQTLLFEHPTIARLAAELEAMGRGTAATVKEAPAPAPVPAVPATASNGIAVIAVAGRFPGARTVEEFWQALEEGRDCVREVPAERWDVETTWSPRKGRPLASHCRWGGFIDDVDRFDAGFFGYSPREAALADPQERLFLETAWHLLERAGHTRAWLGKRYGNRVGVFVGAMYQHYKALEMDAESRALLLLSSYSAIANRTSFFFDLQGPSVAVDSMCSSGLQAVHQACQSLAAGECRLAIAGGVNLSLLPEKYVGLSQAGLVGSHAASRSFTGGDGYLPSEGVGAVLLKPLAEALADGDTVLAVIRASMTNHAGHSAGYAVPNVDAQARLLAENLEAAGIDPRSIGYVEAAANGSPIGDAIELRALGRVFAGAQGIPLGSVKANLGHAEAASGMAQLTRVLLQFQHRRLVPSPGLPGVEAAGSPFAGTPFVPQLQAEPWHPRIVDGEAQPLRASVSSFGAGGSNVHLVLQEAPASASLQRGPEGAAPFRFPVSARTPDQLAAVLRQLAAFVRATPDVSLDRLSRTLRFGREAMACGVELTASSVDELVAGLEAAATNPSMAPLPQMDEEGDRRGVLVLPGYPFARERHWIGRLPEASSPELEPTSEPGSTARGSAPLETLRQTVAAILGVSPSQVPTDRPLRDLGVDSMGWMRLVYAVEEAHGHALTHDDLDRHPTLAALAARIAANEPSALPVAAPTVRNGPWQSPLGEGQKGLWVLQTLYPGRTDYNVPLAFRVSGIDEQALFRACLRLCESFPVLTARVAGEGERLEAGAAPRLATLSIPKEIEPAEFARRRLARPFDLAKDAPVRFELLQGGTLGPGESLVLVTFHHIAIDGASAAVAARLLWQAYAAFASGGTPPSAAAANRADYADFIAWERDVLASTRGEEQLRYWRETLSGELPGLDLPADRDALAAETGRRDGAVEQRLPRALVARMREVLQERGTSPAAFHLAVLSALLYRHTGQEDLIVGVPTLRRPQRRFEETIGYCANMMALRIAVDGELPAAALLDTAQRALGEGKTRADVPFAAVAQGLGGAADGRAPWQVGYAYQNFPQGTDIDLPPELGRVEHLPQIRQPGDAPFGLEVYEEDGGLLLVASFDGERFSTSRIERMLGHYQLLASAMLDDLETPLGELAMLTRAERERALYSWSAATEAAPPAGLVHEWIEARLRQAPSAEVLGGQGETLTGRQLQRQVERLCLTLTACGIRQGDRVAVLAGREAGGIAGLLSVLSIGAVWVPLDPDHPDERLSLILRDAGATLVLAPKGLAARARKLAAPGMRVVRLDRDGWDLRPQLARRRPVALRAEDPAYIIYTSGSTGTPKGVAVSHGALAGHCRAVVDHYGLGERDAVLQFASPGVDTALEQILPALASGARLVLGGTAVRAPSDFLKLLERERITVADLPPVYLRELLQAWKAAGSDLSRLSLRLLICGGEALGPDVVSLWADSGLKRARLLNAYGPTEATITALLHDVTPDDRGAPVPIGRPLAGTRIYILDRHGNPVPDGVVGELHIGGARLAIGYHGRDDLTHERFVLRTIDPGEPPVRLYRTGDLAAFLPNSGGTVAFHGRIDDQVKIRGFRVEPGEVEAALAAEGLGEVVVLAETDGEGRAFLAAFVVAPEAGFDAAALRDRLAARLPLHMLPSTILRIDALPVGPGGKIDRRALRRLAERPALPQDAVAEDHAPDEVEALLLEVWARALNRNAKDLRRGDRFSDSGGDSLAAVRLLGGIERSFGVTLSVADLGAAATLGQQADLLRRRLPAGAIPRKADDAGPPSLIVPLRLARRDDAPALFLVHPVAGTVSCYAGLAAALPDDWSVHGIRASGLVDGESPAATSLPAMASGYVDQLRRLQAKGPYRLAGWSMGGVLAFEMARQLEAAGERVDVLALLDSYTPAERAELEPWASGETAEQACRTAFVRDLLGGDALAFAAGEDFADRLLAMPAFARRHPGLSAADLHRLFAVFAANQAALADYTPAPVETPLTLVRTEQGLARFGTAGWRALAAGGFALHETDGDHHSFLQPPRLQGWIGQLSQLLAGLEAKA